MAGAPILILGAGPAGSYLAARLATSGARVVIVADRDRNKPWLETLSSESLPLLARLGVEPARRCTTRLSAWGSDDIEERSGILYPHGHDRFVSRDELDARVCAAAVAAGADMRSGTITHVARTGARWQVAMSDGTSITASWLVDASGRACRIARMLGSRRIHFDHQVAVAVELCDAAPELEHATLVASFTDGWWYAGPRAGGGTCAIMFTDSDLDRPARDPSCVPALAARCRGVGATLSAFAARTELAYPASGPSWIAVGDAAASVDPLSARGLLFALEGSEAAAAVVLGRASLCDYEDRLHQTTIELLAQRTHVYRSEARWRDRTYWSRRTRHLASTA